jgi:hypothetical protein
VIGQGIVEISGAPTPKEVLYVEGLKANLLNISQFCDHDLVLQFLTKECNIFNSQGKWLMGGDRTVDNYYCLSTNPQINCNKATLDTGELWHQRLGHLNFCDLVKVSKMEAIVGLPKIHQVDKGKCGPCQFGKLFSSQFFLFFYVNVYAKQFVHFGVNFQN